MVLSAGRLYFMSEMSPNFVFPAESPTSYWVLPGEDKIL